MYSQYNIVSSALGGEREKKTKNYNNNIEHFKSLL